MDKSEYSILSVSRKQSKKREPRFQFQQKERQSREDHFQIL
jgi:hypothetical protein